MFFLKWCVMMHILHEWTIIAILPSSDLAARSLLRILELQGCDAKEINEGRWGLKTLFCFHNICYNFYITGLLKDWYVYSVKWAYRNDRKGLRRIVRTSFNCDKPNRFRTPTNSICGFQTKSKNHSILYLKIAWQLLWRWRKLDKYKMYHGISETRELFLGIRFAGTIGIRIPMRLTSFEYIPSARSCSFSFRSFSLFHCNDDNVCDITIQIHFSSVWKKTVPFPSSVHCVCLFEGKFNITKKKQFAFVLSDEICC